MPRIAPRCPQTAIQDKAKGIAPGMSLKESLGLLCVCTITASVILAGMAAMLFLPIMLMAALAH